MIVPILMAHIELKKKNSEAAEQHKQHLEALDSAHAAAVEKHKDDQRSLAILGVTASGWGLGAVVTASVFVALLAIERHLRRLRQVTVTEGRGHLTMGPSR